MANYTDWPNWPVRKQLFVQILTQEQPDVVLFQEVRFDPTEPTTAVSFQNMAEQVLFELNKAGEFLNANIVSMPAAYYPLDEPYRVPIPKGISPFGQTCFWEGLSIISKRPILETFELILPRPGPGATDLNPRANQAAAIEVPQAGGLKIRLLFLNAHFSYAISDAVQNAKDTVRWMTRLAPLFHEGLWIFAGDLNVTPDQEPFRVMIQSGLVVDTWPTINPGNPGYSYKTGAPKSRIDFLLPSGKLAALCLEMHLLGTQPDPHGQYPSDHMGVCATYNIDVPNDPSLLDDFVIV